MSSIFRGIEQRKINSTLIGRGMGGALRRTSGTVEMLDLTRKGEGQQEVARLEVQDETRCLRTSVLLTAESVKEMRDWCDRFLRANKVEIEGE